MVPVAPPLDLPMRVVLSMRSKSAYDQQLMVIICYIEAVIEFRVLGIVFLQKCPKLS